MKFNKEQIKKLEENPNFMRVLPDKIIYTQEFKEKAMQEYAIVKSARQIFIESGFDLSEISQIPDYASRMLSKWRKAKSQKTKTSFRTTESLFKLLYLVSQDIEGKWTIPIQNWGLILNQLIVYFEGRI